MFPLLKNGSSSKSCRNVKKRLFMVCYQAVRSHKYYKIKAGHQKYQCKFKVLDQVKICKKTEGPIEHLFGLDIAWSLFTTRNHTLNCGLAAFETFVGFSYHGKGSAV